MCDFGRDPQHFGFLVDVPAIRELIAETRRLTEDLAEVAARVEALKPAFSRLLAADGWLPDPYASPDTASGMGGGIGHPSRSPALPPLRAVPAPALRALRAWRTGRGVLRAHRALLFGSSGDRMVANGAPIR